RGIPEKEVEWVELSPKEWEPALVGKRVDAVFVMEPEATQMLDDGVAVPLAHGVIAELFPDAPLSGHWVTDAFIRAHGDAARKVARAYVQALERIRQDPAKARLSYARHTH